MIDTDLAQLYGVPTYRLNEGVERNRNRFPSDFMFQLDKREAESLTSQFAISKKGRGGAIRRLTLSLSLLAHAARLDLPPKAKVIKVWASANLRARHKGNSFSWFSTARKSAKVGEVTRLPPLRRLCLSTTAAIKKAHRLHNLQL
jgi:hypothetical protein